MTDGGRYGRASAAIDAANAADPVTVTVGRESGPRELVSGRMAAAWAGRLRPDAGEVLLLAARAHHVRRWELPRSSYPEGRAGYLQWRTKLKEFHAEVAAGLLAEAGYGEAEAARVRDLVRRRNLGHDADAQTVEDAACLVFLETQFAPFAAKTDREKLIGILRKTWRKMSPAAQREALSLAFAPEERAVVEEALG